MVEQFANDVGTELADPIDGSQTTFTVDSSDGFPDTPFRVRVNDELMLVTEIDGTSWTVERGIEDTSPEPHGDGNDVFHVLTAGALALARVYFDPGSGALWIGNADSANGTSAIALGNDAEAIGANSPIAIGLNTSAGSSSTAVGRDASADGGATALGWNASADNGATALGRDASADGIGTALGRGASAGASNATALGRDAEIPPTPGVVQGPVALGRNAQTTAADEGVLGVETAIAGPSNWNVPGNFSVQGSKSFEILHPDDPDRMVRHGSYEGPVPGGTVYRERVTVEGGEPATLELPDYFDSLNTDVDVHVSPVRHFGRAYGEVAGNELTVHADSDGEYAVLILGTRNDPKAQESWGLYQDVRPAGVNWDGYTKIVDDDEDSSGENGVQRVRRRYRAPEGEVTQRSNAHYIGYIVDLEDGNEDVQRVKIDRDDLPRTVGVKGVVQKAREFCDLPPHERPSMRHSAAEGRRAPRQDNA